MASQFDEGLLVGLLIGEGHFGGDGRQPQVTLRMHERHEALFRWIEATFPGGRLYGPYEHGGRRYYQWMARGAYLREEIAPLLRRVLSPSLDRYAHARFLQMCDTYGHRLAVESPFSSPEPEDRPTPPREPLHRRDPSLSDRAAAAFAALRNAEGVDRPGV
jgi:hypothetical protein